MKKFQLAITVLLATTAAYSAHAAKGEGSGSDLEGRTMYSTDSVAILVEQVQNSVVNGECDLQALRPIAEESNSLKTKSEVFEFSSALTTAELGCLRELRQLIRK